MSLLNVLVAELLLCVSRMLSVKKYYENIGP